MSLGTKPSTYHNQEHLRFRKLSLHMAKNPLTEPHHKNKAKQSKLAITQTFKNDVER